jgi:hypothetical protein
MLAKILQLAILTGTDITDNLALVVVEGNSNGEIVPTPEYQAVFDTNIQRMLAQAQEIIDSSDDAVEAAYEEN